MSGTSLVVIAAQVREGERRRKITSPGSHVNGDRSLTPQIAAGRCWEGRQGFVAMFHYHTEKAGAALASGISPHGGFREEVGWNDSPRLPCRLCLCLSVLAAGEVSVSGAARILALYLVSNGPTSRWQAEPHGSVETAMQEGSWVKKSPHDCLCSQRGKDYSHPAKKLQTPFPSSPQNHLHDLSGCLATPFVS